MKTKVGQEYRTHDDVRKRDKLDVMWATIWLVLFIGYTSFIITCSVVGDFWSMPIKDIILLSIICNIPNAIFALGFGFMITHEEHVDTLEFRIHQYDRWNFRDSKYETYYITEAVTLNATYVYHKHTGDFINKMTQEELEEYCKTLPHGYSEDIGYETQEEAMNEILQSIKNFIANDKASENIKIKNISTLETFTVEELKKKVNNGDFKKDEPKDKTE
jgi:hypothetical protein